MDGRALLAKTRVAPIYPLG